MPKKISIRIENALDTQLRHMANEKQMTLSEHVVALIETGLRFQADADATHDDCASQTHTQKTANINTQVKRHAPSSVQLCGTELRYIMRLVFESLAINRQLLEQQTVPKGHASFDDFYAHVMQSVERVFDEFDTASSS